METFIMTAQLLLALTILVGIHELGHLLAAKLFKIKVEKFYLFFDFLFPFPNILNFALFKIKRGDTEYGLGWFPLGGYVKIAGMIDESMDKEQLKQPAQPWEFRSKPAWQRLIVMLGGIIFNVITGVILFIFIVFSNGEQYIPASELKDGIVAYELAEKIGLKTGDKILKINEKPIERFEDIFSSEALLGSNSYFIVERDGKQIRIDIPNDLVEAFADKKQSARFVEPALPFSVGEVSPNMGAWKAGVKRGDKILKINETNTTYFHQLQAALKANKGKEVTLTLERKGEQITAKATISEEGLLGFRPIYDVKYATVKYSVLESIPRGTFAAFGIIGDNIQGFSKIFRGEVSASKSLSGPIGIAQVFGGEWDWARFWRLTAILSMVLAFMNLLPIPALDGGHVVFLLYEMVVGKPAPEKVQEVAQSIGMLLLLALMVFVFFNDLFK